MAEAKHARKRATSAAAARNREAAEAARKPRKPKAEPRRRVYHGGRPMGAPRTSTGREITPRQVAAAPGKGAALVTQRKAYGAKHMLTAELIAGVLIVAIRAVADYEPQADGTLKGKVGHPKGQYGPLPILAGLIVTFFVLSFFAASGGLKAKLAVIAGAIVDLALLMNSATEFEKVTGTFSTFGKAKVPPGDWQTTGAVSGLPISGSLGGSTGSSGSGTPQPPKSSNPQFPVPPGSIAVPKGGCPPGWLEGGDMKGHTWCSPITPN